MQIKQEVVTIHTKGRGYFLVTREIESRLGILLEAEVGLAHLFLMHTSASLTINENADPDVRGDFKAFEERLVPRDFSFAHTMEGSDDMPAHIKSSLFGNALTIPVRSGKFLMGIWQGIYLCEHRDFGSVRRIACTVIGE